MWSPDFAGLVNCDHHDLVHCLAPNKNKQEGRKRGWEEGRKEEGKGVGREGGKTKEAYGFSKQLSFLHILFAQQLITGSMKYVSWTH